MDVSDGERRRGLSMPSCCWAPISLFPLLARVVRSVVLNWALAKETDQLVSGTGGHTRTTVPLQLLRKGSGSASSNPAQSIHQGLVGRMVRDLLLGQRLFQISLTRDMMMMIDL